VGRAYILQARVGLGLRLSGSGFFGLVICSINPPLSPSGLSKINWSPSGLGQKSGTSGSASMPYLVKSPRPSPTFGHIMIYKNFPSLPPSLPRGELGLGRAQARAQTGLIFWLSPSGFIFIPKSPSGLNFDSNRHVKVCFWVCHNCS